MSALLEATALPNLHPAVVHFPLVLLPTALLFNLLGAAAAGPKAESPKPRLGWAGPGATALYVLAAVSALAARFTGERAEDGLVGVLPQVQPRIATHDDWALYSTIALAAAAALAVAGVWLAKRGSLRRAVRISTFVVGLVAAGLLLRTADLGGALVYRYGVAVASAAAPPEPAVATTPAPEPVAAYESRIERAEDGTIDWRPTSDERALAELVRLPAEDAGTIAVLPGEPTGAGLTIRFDTEAPVTFVLPDEVGDAEVRLWLEIVELEGAVGVVHHVTDAHGLGRFAISSTGDAVLSESRNGAVATLDRDDTEPLGAGALELAVSASGRHLKGLRGEETAAHGHAPVLSGRRAGLSLEGRGTVTIRRLRIVPIG